MTALIRTALVAFTLSLPVVLPSAAVVAQSAAPASEVTNRCPGLMSVATLLGTSEEASTAAHDLPEDRQLAGVWRDVPRMPFPGPFAAAIWTGDEVLVVKVGSGRTATYQPGAESWTEGEQVPQETPMTAGPTTWTDDELVIVGDTSAERDGSTIGGLAYRPSTDSWREIADLGLSGRSWEGFSDAIWTGAEVVAITWDRHVAAYRPGDDCWVVFPDVPATAEDGQGQRIYRSGDVLLAETRSPVAGIAVSRWDPISTSWSLPSQGPAEWMAGGRGGFWVNGGLAYYTKNPGGLDGLLDGRLDPGSMVWTETSQDCVSRGGDFAVKSAGLLVDRDAFQAMEPGTGACYALPRRKPSWVGGQIVSAGDDVYYLSGAAGESDPRTRRGWVFHLANAVERQLGNAS